MYNVHRTINVLRVSSLKIALIFVILILDDNLRIFCIREFPIRRLEKFLTPLELGTSHPLYTFAVIEVLKSKHENY